jgi:hypothetical protein
MHMTYWFEIFKESIHLENEGSDGIKIFKWILNKSSSLVWCFHFYMGHPKTQPLHLYLSSFSSSSSSCISSHVLHSFCMISLICHPSPYLSLPLWCFLSISMFQQSLRFLSFILKICSIPSSSDITLYPNVSALKLYLLSP